jgi:competence protein ComEC
MFGILWMLLPSGFPARWLGALMILPMFLISPETPPYGAIRMMVFDVGQGLAVSVQTRNHALLFDSGPDFNGEADSGNRILVPALRGMGIAQLDGLILSHNDLDHTGGAVSVLQAIPVSWVSSSLETDNEILEPVHDIRRCEDGQSWDWDGVHFEILHPSRVSYRQEDVSTNNRGCVLSISSGSQTVLLTADIEKDTENRLLKLHPEKLPATLMVVPHHGSKTSSTQEFVQKVRPRYAIFTMGYRNRFHHPRPEVVARYSDIGSELFRSDEDGAIIIQMNAADLTLERYRKTHARYWYQNHGEKEVSSFAAADN